MKGQQPAGKTEHLLKGAQDVIQPSVPKATPVDTAGGWQEWQEMMIVDDAAGSRKKF